MAAIMKPGALIVGGAHVSIGVARSLGRRGIPVWLMANHPIAKYSRYVERNFDWPGADHPQGLSSIIDVATTYCLDRWVLIATGDQDVRMIAENRDLLSKYFRVATAAWDVIKWTYDKRLTYQRAAELGMDCPWSFHPETLADVKSLDCRFPVILKPAVREGSDEFTQAKAWRADNRASLMSLYVRAAALVGSGNIIVQEWIPGSGETQYSYAGLWDKGRPVASLIARRTRQHPIDFGRSSTFVETVDRPEVEDLASRFLASIDYTGVAEVEFKYDARDDRYKLLDVNGRFWTWNGLGSFAGVDFPYLAWRHATGQSVEPLRSQPGCAWMHASRDIVAAFQEMKRGTLTPGAYLKSFARPLSFANFAMDDPLPALVELPVAGLNRLFGGSHRGGRRAMPVGARGRMAK